MEGQAGVTGVILAGGRSRRLGRDKRVEPVGGQPLIARVMARLAGVCDELVAVVADDASASTLPAFSAIRVATDIYPGRGSLGGIYSGLAAASNPWALAVACDMPFLNQPLLRHLLTLREGFDVVVPLVDGRPEPAHALYARACLPAIQRRLGRDELKISLFFDEVRTRYVPEEEVRRFDPDLLTFFNVNTQEDLEQALALAREGR